MLHVVLYEPEIPQNTGNIIRTCMATGSRLHLIEPLGFSLDEKHLRRSGMDYIKDADIHIHKNWEEFVKENPSDKYYFMTRYGHKAPGVYSARWMGEDTSYDVKNAQIIKNVEGKTRTARFVCVIAYIDENGKGHTYRGEVEGQINDKILGSNGFGYDPIFYYPEYGTTLANVSSEMKNKVSHRSRALEKFLKDWRNK